MHQAGGVGQADVSALVFHYIRLARMVRFLLVLRQLVVLTVGSGGGSGSLIPGLRVPPKLRLVINITYSALVLIHFFACTW